MAITYPITLPSSPGFRQIEWAPESAIARVESPYTFQSKIYAWDGQRRKVTVTLPPMDITEAKSWMAAIYSLNGIQGTFYLKDSGVGGPTQIATYDSAADILVNGADQTGDTLAIDGYLVLSTVVLTKGDWLSIGDRLYTCTQGMITDGSGGGNITLWPNILVAPADNDPILVGSAARGIFRLTDWPEMGFSPSRLMEGFSFTAEEVL